MVGLKRWWNRFLNWFFPNRRARLLSKIMKSDQELGLYDEGIFTSKKLKVELNKDKKKD